MNACTRKRLRHSLQRFVNISSKLKVPSRRLTEVNLERATFPIDVLRDREIESVARLGYFGYAYDL